MQHMAQHTASKDNNKIWALILPCTRIYTMCALSAVSSLNREDIGVIVKLDELTEMVD